MSVPQVIIITPKTIRGSCTALFLRADRSQVDRVTFFQECIQDASSPISDADLADLINKCVSLSSFLHALIKARLIMSCQQIHPP